MALKPKSPSKSRRDNKTQDSQPPLTSPQQLRQWQMRGKQLAPQRP